MDISWRAIITDMDVSFPGDRCGLARTMMRTRERASTEYGKNNNRANLEANLIITFIRGRQSVKGANHIII